MSAPDKFSAVWVSHSSITDFIRCPRAYFLKNVYKDPKTGNKIQLVSPSLSLGSAVHEVIESLSVIPTQERFKESLASKYEKIWSKNSGKRGGFVNEEVEQQYKQRGLEMLQRVSDNPGPLKRLSVKLKPDLPYFSLSESNGLILCGKIDWLEYLPDTDSVHIIDFKTSKAEEDPKSLQLPIYYLLATRCQKRAVVGMSYWYVAFADELKSMTLPDPTEAYEMILGYAKQIKLARKLDRFRCAGGELGCAHCKDLEKVLRGEAEFVGSTDQRRDLYLLSSDGGSIEEDGIIL